MTAAAPPLAADLTEGLRRLKLAAMRQLAPELLLTAKTQRWTPEELLRTLIEAEISARDASNARTRLKNAAFPVTKTLDEFDLGASSVPPATVAYLASLEWITAAENLCLVGPAGTGKSHRRKAARKRPGFTIREPGTSPRSPSCCAWYSIRTARRCRSPRISTRSRGSRRRVPSRRSQIVFMRGTRTALRRILAPVAWKTASNEAVKFDPRSRITDLMSSNRWSRVRARLRARCTVHSPLGLAVTLPRCTRRVPCSMNTRTYSLQQRGVHVQEVDREDPGGLGVQELPPSRA